MAVAPPAFLCPAAAVVPFVETRLSSTTVRHQKRVPVRKTQARVIDGQPRSRMWFFSKA